MTGGPPEWGEKGLGGRLGLATSILAFGGLGLVALATPSQAEVLVSNFNETASQTTMGFYDLRQVFTTGSNASTIQSIQVKSAYTPNGEINATDILNLKVEVWTVNASDQPGVKQFTFVNPTSVAQNTDVTFTAPANANVAANTDYFLVIDFDKIWAHPVTESDNQTGATGWSLADSITRKDGTDTDAFALWEPTDNTTGTKVTPTPFIKIEGIATTPGVSLSATMLSVDEDGSGTYTVKLNTLPSGSVTITPSSGDAGAATVSPATLTFTTSNWDTAKTVTVSGVDDIDTNNETVTISHRVSGYGTVSTADGVTVTVTDNDASGAPAVTVPNVYRVPAVLGVDFSGISDPDGKTNIATNATYQWVRVDGSTDSDISGATSATYTLTPADVAKKIKVKVSFTDDAGNSEGPLTSAAVPAGAANTVTAAAACAAPTYTGGAVEIWKAKLTVGGGGQQFSNGTYNTRGFIAGEFGALDDVTFDVDEEHTILTLTEADNTGQVLLYFDPALAATAQARRTLKAGLVLHVCETPLALASAVESSSGESYTWTGHGLDWSRHVERTVYLSRDAVAPTLGSSAVTGATLTLAFSEDLNTGSVPAATVFTVKVDGTAVNLAATDPVTISGKTVTLTLENAVTAGQTVTVAYTKPASNALQDPAGNETATFPDQTVTNNDAANNLPVFTEGASTTRGIAENTATGTNIGTPVAATDDVGDTLTYSLTGTDAASFDLDTANGQLKTRTGLDHEVKPSYSVTLTVTDSRGATDTIAVTVNITDVNEPPDPPAAPVVTASIDATILAVRWTAPTTTGRPAVDSHDVRYRQGVTGEFIDGPQSVTTTTNTAAITGLIAETMYQVQVRATNDEGDSGWSASGSGTTNTAVSNSAPAFTDGAAATRGIAENTAAGRNIGAPIAATDTDTGDTLTYALSGADAASFDLDIASGQLKTRVGVTYDHEAKAAYSVTVTVNDSNGGLSKGGTDTIDVTVNITDVAEPPAAPAAPAVTSGSDTTSLSVNWTAPATTGRPDITGYDLRYRQGASGDFTDGPQGVTLTNSGGITIRSLLGGTEYQIQVRASNDEGDGPWSPSVTATTRGSPPGNNEPVFTDGTSATRGIAENTAAGRNIGAPLAATDGDSGDTLYWGLVDSPAARSFDIDTSTGQLKTKAGVTYDHEVNDSYSFIATVSDNPVDERGGLDTITVTINITDVDEPPAAPAAPAVTSGSDTTSLSVRWTAPANTGRPDITGYDLRYRASAGGNFTGDFTNGPQDVTTTSTGISGLTAGTAYQVQVRASNDEGDSDWSDSGAGSANTTGNTAPVFTDGTSATRSIAENTAAGAAIGTPVAATDNDNDTLVWSLGGADAGNFDIDTTSGQLKTKAGVTYNHEARTTYLVSVGVSDGNSGSDAIPVTISITDQAEPPDTPISPTHYVVTSRDDATTLLVVLFPPDYTDRPAITGYDIRYRPHFNIRPYIDGPQGIVPDESFIWTGLTASTLYWLEVRATNDEGVSGWSTPGSVNTFSSQAPIITDGDRTRRSIAENTAAGVNIGAPIAATDRESGETLTWSLSGGDADRFDIDSGNGQLKTRAGVTYDHEAKGAYSFAVRVSDGRFSDSIDVTINITDVAEPPAAPAAPAVTSGSDTTSLSVNWTAPATTGRPDITGYDLRYRAGITGDFTNGPQNVTGANTTITGLIAGTQYQVQVRATNDEGDSDWSAPRTGSTNTTGNAPPTFTGGISTTRSLAENSAAGQNIGTPIAATDTNTSDPLTWTLGGPDARNFAINPASGQLQTITGVTYDHEGKAAHAVVARVSDGNGGSDSIAVTINITDVNEPPAAPATPVVTSGGNTSLSVSWSAPANTGRPDITGYDVQYRQGASGSFTDGPDVTGAATSIAITGLTVGTTYQVRVRAKNAEGNGRWSALGTGTTAPNTAPTFDEGASTTRSIRENIEAGRFIGEGIQATDDDPGDYRALRYALSGADAANFIIFPTTGQLVTKTGVTYDHEAKASHSITVTVSDGNGGSASIAVTIHITDQNEQPATPAAPTVSATANSSTSLDVSWTEPGLNGGPALTGYDVQYRQNGTTDAFTEITGPATTATSTAIPGLTADTAYEVQVRALNGETPSAWSSSGTGSTPPDTTAPAFSSATASGTSLVITFDEALAAAANLANSAFAVKKTPSGGSETTVTLGAIAPVISGSTVTLTLAGSLAAADGGIKVSYTLPTSDNDNRIEDPAGNETATFTNQAVTNTTTNDTATGAPSISVPNVYRVPAVLTADLSGIADTDGVTGIAGSATWQWLRVDADGASNETDISGATSATYTLTAADVGKKLKVRLNFTDDANNAEGPLTSAAVPSGSRTVTAVATCAAPTYTGGAVEIWKATLTVGGDGQVSSDGTYSTRGFSFSSVGEFGALDDVTFEVDGQSHTIQHLIDGDDLRTIDLRINPALAATAEARRALAAELVLHVCETPLALLAAASEYNNGRNYEWTDHGIDWSHHVERTVYLSRDTAAPALSATTPPAVDGATLTLTFDEDLDTGSVPDGSVFTVNVDGTDVDLATTDPVTLSGGAVTLTLKAAVTAGQTVTVAYAKPASNALKDAVGNETAPFTGQPVANNTAPAFSSATANGASLVITFDEALAAAANLANSAFAVKKTPFGGGAEETVALSATTPPVISDSTVTLTLAVALGAGDTGVKVSYTKPDSGSDNRLGDTVGNETATFADRAVTNATPGVIVSLTTLTVDEGRTNTYTVKLAALPTAAVTVTPLSSEVAAARVTGALTFTPGNWSTVQTVTVSGVEDTDADAGDETVTVSHTVSGGGYDSVTAPSVMVTVADNDANRLRITHSRDTTGNFCAGTDFNDGEDAVSGLICIVTLGGDITGLRQEHVEVENGTIENFRFGGRGPAGQRVAVLVDQTAPAGAEFVYRIPAGVVNNNRLAEFRAEIKPAGTLTMSTSATAPVTGEFTLDMMFSERVRGDTTESVVGRFSLTPRLPDRPTGVIKCTNCTPLRLSGFTPTGDDDFDMRVRPRNDFEGELVVALIANSVESFDTPGTTIVPAEFRIAVDTKAPRIDSVTRGTPASSPTNADTLVWRVVFSEAVENVTEDDFTLAGAGLGAVDIALEAVAGETATWDVTASGGNLAALDAEVTLSLASGQDIEDAVGNRLVNAVPTGADETTWVLDNTAPAMPTAAANGTFLVITFDEALAPAANLANGAFTVKKTPDGGSETSVALAATAPVISGRTVTLTLAAALLSSDTDVKVSYTRPDSGSDNRIEDPAGNEAATFTDVAVASDTAAPMFESAAADGASLVITFDEALAAAANLANGAFAVKKTPDGGGETSVALAATAPVIRARTVTLTLATALLSSDTDVKVSYTRPDSGSDTRLEDPVGNETATFIDKDVANATPDIAPPMVISATADGASLVIAFDEPLAAAANLANSAFTVRKTPVGGGAEELVALSAATPPVISARTVTLTLATALAPGDTGVKVRYTRPGSDSDNRLEDAAGNETATFTERVPNATLGVIVSVTALTVAEGDTGTWTVRLATQPDVEVTVTPVSDDLGAATVFPEALTFTPVNWSTARTVTVTGVVDDADTDNESVTVRHEVTDYGSVTRGPAVTVTVTDNAPATGAPSITVPNVYRVPSVLRANLSGIVDTDGVTGIAGSATYQWLRVDGATDSEITDATGATYTLTTADVGKKLKVRVSFTDDEGNAEAPLTSVAAPSSGAVTAAAACATPTLTGGAAFVGSARKLVVGRGDSNSFGYRASGFGPFGFGSLDGTTLDIDGASFTIRTVVVFSNSFQASFDTEEALPEESSLALHVCDRVFPFAPARVDDNRYQVGLQGVRYAWRVSDLGWSDHAERTVWFSRDTVAPTLTAVAVDGTTLTLAFSEDLDEGSVPDGDVFTVDADGTAVSLATSDPVTLSGNTVTLTLAAAVSGGQMVTVSYAKPSSGATLKDAFGNEVAGFTGQDATDGAPGVIVSATALTVAEGDTGTWTVKLATNPGAAMTVTPVSGDPGAATVSGALTFTTGNWSTAQTVTVTGVDDADTDDESVTVSHTVRGYGSVTAPAVTVTVTDDNAAPTGAPTVSVPNVYRVPAVLTADLSGIADGDGVTGIAGNATWQWVRVDGTTETDITGETSSTYTLTAADVGKKLKVRLNFTDDANNAEGPLTSAAVPSGSRTVTAAATCAAPTYTGGAVEIWKATFTVGGGGQLFSDGTYATRGFSSVGEYDHDIFGALDDVTFEVDGQSHTIQYLADNWELGDIDLRFDPALADTAQARSALRAGLVLHVCETPLAFASAVEGDSEKHYTWTDHGIDWSYHVERTLYLSRDTAAPALSATTPPAVDGATLTLTFDEDLDTGSVPADSVFTVNVDGTDVELATTDPVTISGGAVTLTLAAAVADGQTVMVSYAKPGTGNTLKDAFGNEAASFTDQLVDNDTPDTTPPMVISATADGASLVITFDEALAPAASLANGAFGVKKTPVGGGAEENVTLGPTAPVISGRTMTLTLAAALAPGDTGVKVSYTKPATDSGNRIEDADGNETANFTDQAVTNNTPGVVLSPTTLTVDEEGTGTYTVKLATDPGAEVTVTPTSGDTGAATVTGALTFTTGNWSTAQTVTVTGPADADTDDETVTVSHAVTGYTGVASSASVTVTITDSDSANTRPTSADTTVTIDEDATKTFAASDFSFTDTDTGDALASVKVTTLPAAGALSFDGTALAMADLPRTVTKADLDADKLVFTPAADANGDAYATFMFKVSDGTSDSADAYTMTVDVTAVNDPPVVDNGIADTLATVRGTFSYTFKTGVFDDAETATLTYTARREDGTDLPAWLTFTPETRTFSGTPPASAAADTPLSVEVTARDEGGLTVSSTFGIFIATTFPTAPGSFTATPGDSKVLLAWTAPSDNGGKAVEKYQYRYAAGASVGAGVMWSDVPDGPDAGDSKGDETGVTVESLTNGTAYAFEVRAVNAVGDSAAAEATATPTDTTAPAFSSATADGASLVITFDEALAPAASLANGAFGVKKTPVGGGGETSVTLGATAPVISSRTVTLTLATALAPGDTGVKVSYTQPGSGSNNKIEDAVGNETASFADKAVTNNTPGVILSATTLTVAEEGAGGTYTVKLATDPGGDVTVTPSSGDEAAATVTGALTFTTGNWNTAQTVTVSGEDDIDTDDESVTVTHAVSGYTGVTAVASVTVTVTDNDIANNAATGKPAISGKARVGQTLTAAAGDIADTDGLPTTTFPTGYTLQWTREDADGMNKADISGATSGTYTPVVADVGKKIRVEASFTDDASNSEGPLASDAWPASGTVKAAVTVSSIAVTSTPAATSDTYGVGEKIRFTVTFSEEVNVSAGRPHFNFALGPAGSPVTTPAPYESGTGTTALVFAYTVLAGDSDPNGIWIRSSSENTLALETGEYIRAVSDAADAVIDFTDQGGQTNHKVNGSLALGVVVDPTTLTVVEEAAGGTYTVKLGTQPSAGVTVTPTSGDTGAATLSPAALTFTTSNWSTAQTITVTGVTDTDTDNETVTVTHAVTSTDTNYAALPAPSVTVTVTDNDSANSAATGKPAISGKARVGQTLTAAVGTIADTDGLPTTTFPTGYTLQWTREDADGMNKADISGATSGTYTPVAADVGKKIRVEASFTDDASNSEGPLTSDAWPGTGTVKAAVTVSTRVAVTSTPAAASDTYGLGEKIRFTVTFSEEVNVSTGANQPHFEFSLGPSGGGVVKEAAYESGSGGTALVFAYTVLASDSDDNGIWIGDQDDTLDLDSGEYIRAVSDGADAVLTHSSLGTQSGHKVDGSLTDGVVVSPTTLTVTEGNTGTYTVQLGTNPGTSVTVTPSSSDNGAATVSPAMTFTTTNWNTAQTVTITGVEDLDSTNESVTVSHGVTGYPSVTTAPSVTVTVTDNDSANALPTSTNNTVTIAEDATKTFATSDFAFTDTDAGDALASVKITTLPAAGTLSLDGTAIAGTALPKTVTKAELDSDDLVFTPAANAHGDPYTTFMFKVNDGTADSATAYRMTIDVTPVNDAPIVVNGIPNQTATAGTTFSYAFPANTFNDVDGDTLSYTAVEDGETSLPTWLTFTASTRSFSGTPANTDAGTLTVKVTANDSNSGSVADTFNIVVSAANALPTSTNNTVTIAEDATKTFAASDFAFTDTDAGDALASVKITTLPTAGALSFDGTAIAGTALPKTVTKAELDSDDLVFTPAANAHGDPYGTFMFKVNDGTADSTAAYTMTIDVTPVNDAPIVVNGIPNQTATSGTPFRYTVPMNTFNDVDGDTLSYTAVEDGETSLPTWLTFTASTRSFSGTPADTDVGTLTVKVTANDSNSGSVADTFNIVVSATPTPVTDPPDTTPTPDADPPGAPQMNTPTVEGTAGVVSWRAPSDDGGSPVLRYQYRVSTSGYPHNRDWIDLGEGVLRFERSSHPDVEYFYQVRAVNSAGPGPSISGSFRPFRQRAEALSALTPGSVRNLVATPGDRRVWLSWEAPTTVGEPEVTRYEYRYARGDIIWLEESNPDWQSAGTGGSATITELVNRKDYIFEVRAVNRNGAGNSVLVRTAPHVLVVAPPAVTGLRLEVEEISDAFGLNGGNRPRIVVRWNRPTAPWDTYPYLGQFQARITAAGRAPSQWYDVGDAWVGNAWSDAAAITRFEDDGAFDRLEYGVQYTVEMRAVARAATFVSQNSGWEFIGTDIPGAIAPPVHVTAEAPELPELEVFTEGTATEGQPLTVGLRRPDNTTDHPNHLGSAINAMVMIRDVNTLEVQETVWVKVASGAREGTTNRWTAPYDGQAADRQLEMRLVSWQPGRNYVNGTPAGLRVTLTNAESLQRVGPSVTAVAISPAPGGDAWDAGETVEAVLIFDEAVTVDTTNGTPHVQFELGTDTTRKDAGYASGSGTTALTFRHTVPTGQGPHRMALLAIDSLALNGGTIRSTATGADADLAHRGAAYAGVITQSASTRSASSGPTAQFSALPASHDGANAFEAELTFSGDPDGLSYVTVRNSLLEVTGGAVENAQRKTRSSDIGWVLTVRPSGRGSVTLTLPSRACGTKGAVCIGGEPLASDATATVPGPATVSTTPVSTTPALPTISIAVPAQTPVTEGAALSFTLTRTGATDEALTVAVAVTETGNVLNATPPASVTFSQGSATATLNVGTVDDTTVEEASTVTVRVSDGSGYTVAASGDTASGIVESEDLAPITAQFTQAQDEHDGGAFELQFTFSHAPLLNYVTVRDALFDVTGGRIEYVRRLTWGNNIAWELRVKPDGFGDVTLSARATTDCEAAHGVCDAAGRRFDGALERTIQGPPTLSVTDATVEEAEGATLEFTVTLSRSLDEAVTVTYATADGTATAGSDYRAANDTLTFTAGETAKTVSVAVLYNTHDEGSETLTLSLTSPSPSRVKLADADATGTITNTGPLPAAWTARFGRTVAEQVLDAVEGRMEAGRTAGLEVILAGEPITWQTETAEGSLTPTGEDVFNDVVGRMGRRFHSGSLTSENVLTGSSFTLTRKNCKKNCENGGGHSDKGLLALWGHGAVSSFDGQEDEDDLSLTGDVSSAMVGADWGGERVLAGLVVGHSSGNGSYSATGGNGVISSSLTGLYPWARYELNEQLEVWGAAGYGAGSLTLTPDGEDAMDADLSLWMGAAGLRGLLIDGGTEGFTLAATTDALAVTTTTAAVAGEMAATDAGVTRLRLGLEGSLPVKLSDASLLTTSIEMGLRHDDGDAETGFGLEMGAGLAWHHQKRGLRAELRGRGLLTHAAEGFSNRGLSLSLAWDPTPASALGASFSLSQVMGGAATGGVDALLSPITMAGLTNNTDGGGGAMENQRLELRLGYGLPAFSHAFSLTPELVVGLSETERDYSLLLALAPLGQDGSMDVSLDLTGKQSTSSSSNGAGAIEHSLDLRFTSEF